jgi:Raf kinase inhibitor-like YbhB/YbcL family protein
MRMNLLRSLLIILLIVAAAHAQAPAGGGQRGGQAPAGGGQRGAQAAGGGPRGGAPAVPPMRLMNASWFDGGVIPQRFAGAMGASPELSWTNAPMGAMSFVLLMHDPDGAPMRGSADVLHWLVINIPATMSALPEEWAKGTMPAGTTQIQVYRGPGAPAIAPLHHYTLELFALDQKLDLPANATRADVMKAMDMHVIGKAAYVGLYHQPAAPAQ